MSAIETFIVTFGILFLVSFFFITYLKHLKIKREIAEIEELTTAIYKENARIRQEIATAVALLDGDNLKRGKV
jgi:hypothetical protein